MPRKLMLTLVLSLFFALPCFAHSYPLSEAYIGGVGPNCTLGYVKSIYGEPKSKRWFNTDGVRGVAYYYSPSYQVTGRTWTKNAIPEDEFPVVGYTVKANNLSTPSALPSAFLTALLRKCMGPVNDTSKKGRLNTFTTFPVNVPLFLP